MNNLLVKTVKLCTACIFTVNFSTPAAQRISQVKWLTPVKPEKTPVQRVRCFSALIRSDAADHKATPPRPMKNARLAAAVGHKTTQRRRRPPIRRRTALAKRGLQHGLWTLFRLRGPGLGIQVLGLAIDS